MNVCDEEKNVEDWEASGTKRLEGSRENNCGHLHGSCISFTDTTDAKVKMFPTPAAVARAVLQYDKIRFGQTLHSKTGSLQNYPAACCFWIGWMAFNFLITRSSRIIPP